MPARWRRSPSAGFWSGGRAATRLLRLPAGGRRHSGARPTGPRRRSAGSRARSAVTCSSSSPSGPRAAPGTARPAPPSSSSGRRCSGGRGGTPRRCVSRRSTSSWPSSSAPWPASATRREFARFRTARASGPASSTCARTCSGARSRTCARLPRSPSLTVVGSVNLDLVARCERLPRAGETVTGGSFARYPGGKGANQAVAAARLGAAITFVGAIGEDELAEQALAGMREAGVELRLDRGGATGVALILVDERGENQIVVAPGANSELGGGEVSGAVLCQLEIPVAAVESAAEGAERFFLNAAPARPIPERIVLMGGAIAEGNVTPAAEFNVWADPEAAARVFASGLDVTMIGLDVSHQALVTPGHAERLRRTGRVGRAVAELLDFYGVFHREVYGFGGSPVHDAVAVAYAIRPDLLELEHLNVEIDCESSLCRGRTVVDLWRRTGREPNAHVAVGIDSAGVLP